MTLEDILEAMAQHSRNNPSHGKNCACKDQYLGEAKQIMKELSIQANAEASYLFSVLEDYTHYQGE